MKASSTQRLYYSIKEVGELFDEEQHILRYWEREFDCLRPAKNRAGNRTYTTKDLNVLRVIKKLLRVDRIPVSEARGLLQRGVTSEMVSDAVRALKIRTMIDEPTDDTGAASSSGVAPGSSSPSLSSPSSSSPLSTKSQQAPSTAGMGADDANRLIAVLKSIVQDLEQLA
ncbi:MAG: MerR family transcriptional regulator [Candidatus Kapaibacterium sp.]